MSPLNKIKDCSYYSYSEGLLHFLFYPESGLVKASNGHSCYRAIEFFSSRNFFIDWSRSHVGRNTLHVSSPEYLTQDEALATLNKTREELYAQDIYDIKNARDKIIIKNVDNTTGDVIKEQYLFDTMGRINKAKNKTREDVANWFNHYNLEDIRPETPLILVSTKPKKVIINEGRGLIWQLFEQGKLRKLTKEVYEDKMKSCS